MEVGTALTEIRDGKLYEDKYDDFEEYCRDRWGYGRTHAYRLMDAAGVIKDLSPIGDNLPRPANEAQVRELVQVPTEKRLEAWKKTVEVAGQNPITARVVRAVTAEFKPRQAGKAAKVVKKPKTATASLQPAFTLIEEIEKLARADKKEALLDKVAELQQYLKSLAAKLPPVD